MAEHNPAFGEIVTRLVGSLSLEQASIHIGRVVTGNTINGLMKGKVGRPETVQAVGRGFAARICELYGGEVKRAYGACNEETAGVWLVSKAGFTGGLLSSPAPPPAPSAPSEYLQIATEAATQAIRQYAALRPWPEGASLLLAGLSRLRQQYGRTPDLADMPTEPTVEQAQSYLAELEAALQASATARPTVNVPPPDALGRTKAQSPDLSHGLPSLGVHDSVFNRLSGVLAAKVSYYQGKGYSVLAAGPPAEGGRDTYTEEEAVAFLESWERRTKRMNPGKPYDADAVRAPQWDDPA